MNPQSNFYYQHGQRGQPDEQLYEQVPSTVPPGSFRGYPAAPMTPFHSSSRQLPRLPCGPDDSLPLDVNQLRVSVWVQRLLQHSRFVAFR